MQQLKKKNNQQSRQPFLAVDKGRVNGETRRATNPGCGKGPVKRIKNKIIG